MKCLLLDSTYCSVKIAENSRLHVYNSSLCVHVPVLEFFHLISEALFLLYLRLKLRVSVA